MSIFEIIKKYLEDNGYAGLRPPKEYNSKCCGCTLAEYDFMHCETTELKCEPIFDIDSLKRQFSTTGHVANSKAMETLVSSLPNYTAIAAALCKTDEGKLICLILADDKDKNSALIIIDLKMVSDIAGSLITR